MNIRLVFLSSTLTFILFLNIVIGAVFTYIPSDIQINSTSPDATFIQSPASGVTTSLGANRTSANITVKASTSPYEITTNGNYDAGPSPWTFSPGTNLTSFNWSSTLLGRTGVMNISGNASQVGFIPIVMDNASLVELITWPSTTVTNAQLNITYRIKWNGSYFFIGSFQFGIGYEIFDSLNTLIDTNFTSLTPTIATSGDTNWNTFTFNLNPASFNPGENYQLRIVVNFTAIGDFFIYLEVDYYLDQSLLIVTPSKPSFTGVILNLNTTLGIYNVSLYLNSINAVGNVNVSIWLRNHTISLDSTKITIINSAIVSSSTSELLITTVPSGYLSLNILIDTEIDVGASVTLYLTLKYRLYDGVYVEYPIIVTIIDPPTRSSSSEYPIPDEPVKLVIYGYG